jgi:DNA-directed RNA polymerase subunit E'
VRIPPEKFGMPLEEVAEEQLRLRYEGTLDDNLGYIIAITDVKVDPTGRLVMGEGATFHRVRFTMLTFIPEIQEIIEGEVIEVEDFGAFVRIGPMDGLLHISQVMDDVIAYDEKQGMLIGTRSGRILRGGDKVRMRITAVSLAKGVSGRIGVTTRQPFLGKLEWIEDEVRRIREALVKREKRE